MPKVELLMQPDLWHRHGGLEYNVHGPGSPSCIGVPPLPRSSESHDIDKDLGFFRAEQSFHRDNPFFFSFRSSLFETDK